MLKFWLIQRGEFNNFRKKEVNANITTLTGRNGLVDLDYMGSSEFEWGTIPYSYRRIMNEFNDYTLTKMNHSNKSGVDMWLFCNKDNYELIHEALQHYLDNPYQLKECTGLESYSSRSANFWWEVETGFDFMFFYGFEDRAKKFTEVITKDYTDWWMTKTEEERQKDLADAKQKSIY